MKRTCEKEKTEHEGHKGLGEIHFIQVAHHGFLDAEAREKGVGEKYAEGSTQGDDHEPDRMGQLEKAKVQITDQGGQSQKDSGDVENYGDFGISGDVIIRHIMNPKIITISWMAYLTYRDGKPK